jgi:hypothetical protein
LQTAAPLESDALTAWSKAQQTKAALSRIRGRMQFQGSALVKPGVLLELKSVGKHFNGNVIASNVVHISVMVTGSQKLNSACRHIGLLKNIRYKHQKRPHGLLASVDYT